MTLEPNQVTSTLLCRFFSSLSYSFNQFQQRLVGVLAQSIGFLSSWYEDVNDGLWPMTDLARYHGVPLLLDMPLYIALVSCFEKSFPV